MVKYVFILRGKQLLLRKRSNRRLYSVQEKTCLYLGFVMRLSWIYLYLIGSQAVFNYVVGRQEEGYIQTESLGWWEARNKCIEEGNTDLFEPSGTIYVPHQMYKNTHYWVGGFETSQWRWTDNSTLFNFMGNFAIPNLAQNRTIHGNSVFECYRQCNKRIFGLSGIKCYCLDGLPDGFKKDENLDIESCPGNTEEYCGTQSLISVYTIDINFYVGRIGDYRCASMNSIKIPWLGQIHIEADACQSLLLSVCVDDDTEEPTCKGDSRTFFRCEDDLCVSCERASWSSSNQSCSLVKVTPSRESQLTTFLYSGTSYWIGLHKQITRKWVNGKDIHNDFHIIEYKTDPGPRCLALTFTSSATWTAYWIPCNEQHQSLCATRQNSTESREKVSTTQTPEALTEVTEQKRTTSVEGNVIGIIVGAVVGSIVLVTLIVAIILMKRKMNELRNSAVRAMYTVPERPADQPGDHQYDTVHLYAEAKNL